LRGAAGEDGAGAGRVEVEGLDVHLGGAVGAGFCAEVDVELLDGAELGPARAVAADVKLEVESTGAGDGR
jgi:hypothetical protein